MAGSIRALAAVLAIATLIGAAAAGTAQADPRDRRHERAPARHYRHPPPPPPRQNWGYGEQSYVQAPPPVVYAPPPLPFALNFQLNFR